MIGIITKYYKNDNYGGIAQAYALQKFLENNGFESELICYSVTSSKMIDPDANSVLVWSKRRLYRIWPKILLKIENSRANRRYRDKLEHKFRLRKIAFEISRNRIKHSSDVYTCDTIEQASDKYDFFIIGSDQVWHPEVIRPAYLCGFLPIQKKRISYASSITVRHLPNEYASIVSDDLNKFDWISVREESAGEYLRRLLQKKVDVVADPTLLLTVEEWKGMASPRLINGNYIFAYLLGDSKKQRDTIKKLATTMQMPIVFCPHICGYIRARDIGFADIELYDVELPDFLSLIMYANYIFTDSFHGTVFSLLFKKNLWVFEREVLYAGMEMNSRIEELLKRAGLDNRLSAFQNAAYVIEEIDYKEVWERLMPFIDKSRELLIKAVEGVVK